MRDLDAVVQAGARGASRLRLPGRYPALEARSNGASAFPVRDRGIFLGGPGIATAL